MVICASHTNLYDALYSDCSAASTHKQHYGLVKSTTTVVVLLLGANLCSYSLVFLFSMNFAVPPIFLLIRANFLLHMYQNTFTLFPGYLITQIEKVQAMGLCFPLQFILFVGKWV